MMPLWVPSLKFARERFKIPLFRVDAVPCTIVGKENRFVVRVRVGSRVLRAHNSNTGRLHDLIWEGNECLCIQKRGKRTDCKLFAARTFMDSMAILDTRTQEKAFERAVQLGGISWLRGYSVIRASPRIGSNVFDFEVGVGEKRALIELKSADLKGEYGEGMWPDCPTERGARQIEGLTEIRDRERYLVFIVGFPGACCFKPFEGGHRGITNLIVKAMEHGVKVKAIGLGFDTVSNYVYLYDDELPVSLRY